ncbi:hypothetical protein [Gillisia sp. Hel_I_86]|uniref:hypothetical protein n=1 Tax=Gillisia sp. Hel_I_86 TaxID=1249981 RepID=UPI0011A39AEA|nr:hypothetical protein [Gillisia sp. Hel_I_86]
MQKQIFRFLLVTLVGILIYSCQKEDDFYLESQGDRNEPDISNSRVLGKKLENPYSVTNMKKAYDNLKNKSKNANNFNLDIKATHLYIKFIPKSEEELSILKMDSTLILYTYPLDYEIIEGSGYYRDPNVPEG